MISPKNVHILTVFHIKKVRNEPIKKAKSPPYSEDKPFMQKFKKL